MRQTKIPSGIIFQDTHFIVPWFKGIQLKELFGVEDPDSKNKSPIMIYIEGEGTGWHRFYLDICFAVWENCREFEKEDEESYNYIDYASRFEVKNLIIKSIVCEDNQIKIVFENLTRLTLKYKDTNIEDSESELVKEN